MAGEVFKGFHFITVLQLSNLYNFFSAQMNHADLQATFWVKSVSLHEAIYKLDLNNVWYNDLISHKLPL